MYNKDKVDIIKDLFSRCKSCSEVASTLNVPRMTVYRIVRRDDGKIKAKRGPLSAITNRQSTAMKRMVRNYNQTGARVDAKRIKEELKFGHVTTRTIQRHLKRMKFEYKTAISTIMLSSAHKKARVEAVKSWARDNICWERVVFTDEKRFSLDGPDSWSTYTDEGRDIYRNKRQNNGGGIMVWGCITFDGLFYLMECIGNYKSAEYCTFVINQVKPLLDTMFGEGEYLFQQDNCPIHVSSQTLNHFEAINLKTFQWPAKSPDLNIIENVWSWMVNDVYSRNRQFNSKQDLWTAICDSVADINTNKIHMVRELYNSIQSRHLKLVERAGNTINY
mgnify:CR=1 FL=1